MPDFSGVSGWQDSYGLPLSAHGTWKTIVSGASSEAPLCTENRTTYQTQFSGTY